MTPEEMKILVIGPYVWGTGDTLDEALRNASKPKAYIAFIIHPESTVNAMGDIAYPNGFPPKEFHRKGCKKLV